MSQHGISAFHSILIAGILEQMKALDSLEPGGPLRQHYYYSIPIPRNLDCLKFQHSSLLESFQNCLENIIFLDNSIFHKNSFQIVATCSFSLTKVFVMYFYCIFQYYIKPLLNRYRSVPDEKIKQKQRLLKASLEIENFYTLCEDRAKYIILKIDKRPLPTNNLL